MSKPLLCKLGFHKPDKRNYIKVERRHWPSKKKYHRNYIICQRCGKMLHPFGIRKIGGPT